VPLAFLDRVTGVTGVPLNGRPMGVTTGHAIIYHVNGHPYYINQVKGLQANCRSFTVLSGVKLYELGAGIPPQTKKIIKARPFSSEMHHPGWLPCLRTGDIQPFSIAVGRLWVNYGPHLAHPKDLERFTGPRLFVRRVPIWATRQLGAAYIEQQALCAGDVLVIRQDNNNRELLQGLCVFLNSSRAGEVILNNRPSVRYRISYPKISAKDLNLLLELYAPNDDDLRALVQKGFQQQVTNLEAKMKGVTG
ncbi:MAG: hypothetical protein L0Y56_06860, partial [Nitrospira sp.]|nr:hypothetical protein [Nitrospira sp.]